MPAYPATMLRSRSYLRLLVLAAILGVPVSAVADGFLCPVSYLQKELFTRLPNGLGFQAEPIWWLPPTLGVGGADGSQRRLVPHASALRKTSGFCRRLFHCHKAALLDAPLPVTAK